MDDKKYNQILEYWKNRKSFKNEDDIPDIPFVSAEDYQNIIVPNIIRCGGIPKSKLVIGQIYIGRCRNASEATWNGETFDYKRYKFGSWWDAKINHFEDDNGYDLFVPIKLKEKTEL